MSVLLPLRGRLGAGLCTLAHLGPEYIASLRVRFDAKWTAEPNTGCWLWHGSGNGDGYGAIGVGYKNRETGALFIRAAHRISWLLNVGDLPPNVVLDHRCRVRCCVNPAHLEVVTVGENTRRGDRHRKAGAL